jgi:hypothetical protein
MSLFIASFKLDQAGDLLKGVTSDITQPVQEMRFGECSTKFGKCKRCYPVEEGEWGYRLDWGQKRSHFFKKSKILIPPRAAHYNLFQMNQSPYPECRCFWNDFNDEIGGGFPPGPPDNLDEVVPAWGGGPEEF